MNTPEFDFPETDIPVAEIPMYHIAYTASVDRDGVPSMREVVRHGTGQIPEDALLAEGITGWREVAADYVPPLSLDEAKAAKLVAIDAETSAAILAGFTYTIQDQTLHFSYDANDQQNFADTANAATLATMDIPGVPASVTWNGWKVVADDAGRQVSRSLVRLTLDPSAFLSFYVGGALAHKAAQMEIGGQRKRTADAATTLEEVNAA